jgi:hypothetical protein
MEAHRRTSSRFPTIIRNSTAGTGTLTSECSQFASWPVRRHRRAGYPSPSSSKEAGAKALIGTSKLSFLTGMARPLGRARKSTGWAVFAAMPDGSLTTIFPDLPATSHKRSSVPFKAGDDPKAVRITPGRETLAPLRTAGKLPPGPVAAAVSKGTLASKAGTARSFPSQMRTRELHVPEYQ